MVRWHKRQFSCREKPCPRKAFTEQIAELLGKRAWDKFPEPYLAAPAASRLALLQGLLDTDGSIDKHGRIEFSSASRHLTQDTLQLINDPGGRASYRRKTGVHFTSPRQATRKAARDAHRLLNIRLPETVDPFRTEDKNNRMVVGRNARQWTIVDVTAAAAREQ